MNKVALLLAMGLLLGGIDAQASGSAPGRIVKGSKSKSSSSSMDANAYALGQQVYEGKASTSAGAADMASQKSRLTSAAAKVSDAAKSKMLVSLAGKLSEQQLAALEYFVAQRFSR